jgi:hypothetical protein
MSNTPETDAFYASLYTTDVPADMVEAVSGTERDLCRKLERERDALKKQMLEIEEYGTDEINAAVDLRSKLAIALVELDEWKKCAEDLVDYAHEFVAHLSAWGKGYDRHDKQIKQAEDAIEMYVNLKNRNSDKI